MAHPYIANGSVYDDFRAVTVGTNINTRTSDSGHTWGSIHGTESWTIQAGTGWPTGDAADGNVAGNNFTYGMLGINFGSADVDVLVTLERPVELAARAGLMVRRTADLNSCYMVSTFGGAVEIERFTGITNPFLDPTVTNIASWTGLTTAADLSVLRAVCSGNDITAYLDGVEVGTVTDSTYTGTIHGMYQRFGGASQSYRFYAFNMYPTSRPSGILVGAVAI